jgi:oleate hydratase
MSSSHIMLNADRRSPNRLDAWILGSGISSLASAVSLLQEAHVPPERIHLLESHGVVGGGTASAGDLVNGYHYLAGGMPLFNSVCIEELLSRIPSTARSSKTVLDDMKEYNETNVPKEVPRTRFLVRRPYGLGRIDANRARLGLRDRISVFMLASRSEKSLGRSRISDCFRVGFFKSTYWLTMASTCAASINIPLELY